MMEQRIENLTNKTLRNFTEGDTLYIQKGDYLDTYYCQFVRLDRGVVVAKVLDVDREWLRHAIGTEVRARVKSCFLWGKSGDLMGRPWTRCHWFKSVDAPAE